jgi:hypothetical protein
MQTITQDPSQVNPDIPILPAADSYEPSAADRQWWAAQAAGAGPDPTDLPGLIEREQARYEALGTPFGVFIAGQLEALALRCRMACGPDGDIASVLRPLSLQTRRELTDRGP